MLIAARKIERYSAGRDLAAFRADEMAYDATLRNLEVLGEAAKGRKLLRVIDVPDLGRHKVSRGRLAEIGVPERPARVRAHGIDRTLKCLLHGRALVGGRDHRLEQHQLLLLVIQRSGRLLRDLLDLTARHAFALQPLRHHLKPVV